MGHDRMPYKCYLVHTACLRATEVQFQHRMLNTMVRTTYTFQFLDLLHPHCSRTVRLMYVVVPTHLTHAASKHSMSNDSLTHSSFSKETRWLSRYNDRPTGFTFEESWFDCREGQEIYRFFKT